MRDDRYICPFCKETVVKMENKIVCFTSGCLDIPFRNKDFKLRLLADNILEKLIRHRSDTCGDDMSNLALSLKSKVDLPMLNETQASDDDQFIEISCVACEFSEFFLVE